MTDVVEKMPSQEYLNAALSYDPVTGLLTWKYRPDMPNYWNTRYAGKLAMMSPSNGHYYGRLFDKNVITHRIIWKMAYGVEPNVIDHINGNGMDNRLENLRSVTHAENMRNTKRNKRNTSGVGGVFYAPRDDKWVCKIAAKEIGRFKNKDDAIRARLERGKDHGFHPNHGRHTDSLPQQ